MAPKSGLGDAGRERARANFKDIGRTRTPGTPAPEAPLAELGKRFTDATGNIYREVILPDGTIVDVPISHGMTERAIYQTAFEMADRGDVRPFPEADPVGRPRTFKDARAAADPAIQSDAEAARVTRTLQRRTRGSYVRPGEAGPTMPMEANSLIPGQAADDAARLAEYSRTQRGPKLGGTVSDAPRSWAERVIDQSGKPVPDAPPPMPRPSAASSPLAARAQDFASGAPAVGPGELDDPLTMTGDGPTGTGGPRTPARQAQLEGRPYEGPGRPPPYRPEGADPTKGGRAAAEAARKARLNGEPDLPTVEAEGSRAQARVAREVRGGPVEDTVDALYENRKVPGTLRAGQVATDDILGLGDDIQNVFRQWVIDPNLDTKNLTSAQRAALTELQARTLSLTPANASIAEFTDAVNAVGQRTFGGANWNPVTPRFDTLTQDQVYELYRPRPEYNPAGPRSIRATASNVDDVAMLDRMAADRAAQAASLGKPTSFAEVLSSWDAGTPPPTSTYWSGAKPPPFFNPGTPPPFAGTPPPYAGTPPPYAGTPPPYAPAAAAFDAGTPPPYFNPGTPPPYTGAPPSVAPAAFNPGTPPPYPGTPPPYVPGPPRAMPSAPAPAAPSSLAGGGSGGIGGPPSAPPAAGAAPGSPPPMPGFNPGGSAGTPPPYTPGSSFADEVVSGAASTARRPRGMAGIKSLFGRGGAEAAGEAAGAGEAGAGRLGGLLSGGKGMLGSAVKSFGVPLAVGAAASAGGHALGERLMAGENDRPGWDNADWGQFASGVGDAALPMAGLAPLAAAALGAGPAGWAALGIGALGAGAYGLGKAIWGGGTATDKRDEILSDPTLNAEDRSYFEGLYDRAVASGLPEDQALASMSQQIDQYMEAERARRAQEADQMRYQVTPSQLMTLQTLQMQDMNRLTDQQRLANAAYQAEAQRFAGMPGTNPNLASLALQNANMFAAHAANQAVAYRQAYQFAPMLDMFNAQLDQANRVNGSVASRTASAYAQQLSGLGTGGGGGGGQPDLAALLAQQQQAAPAG